MLHSLGNGNDGAAPYDALIFDAAGNLYGTTGEGGTHYGGTVFELSPRQRRGVGQETVLHSFAQRHGRAVTQRRRDRRCRRESLRHNLLKAAFTTRERFSSCHPDKVGGWTETVLHSFGNGTDGADGSVLSPALVLIPPAISTAPR